MNDNGRDSAGSVPVVYARKVTTEEAIARAIQCSSENKVLEERRSCMEHILNEVQDRHGYTVIIREDGIETHSATSVTTDEEGNVVRRLEWQINPGTAVGLNLLWDLIHEYGHVILLQAGSENMGSPARELEAWTTGWSTVIVIRECPSLFAHRRSFCDRAICCVRTHLSGFLDRMPEGYDGHTKEKP